MNPKVSFVLLHLNQETLTRECIKSLLQLSYKNVEVILIDNASTDGSGERLRKEFPSVIVVRNPQNLGFAEGNNVGMRLALRRDAEFIVLLNNDTIVDQHLVEPLVEIARMDQRVGVQCGKIFFFSDPEKLWYAGGVLDVARARGSHRGMLEQDTGRYDAVEDTEFASGCLMFFSREAVERVGFLDPRFFIYLEDADWCVRARQLGYRIVYNPKAVLWHKVSATHTIDSPFYLYFTMRNKIIFVRKHTAPSQWLFHLPYFLYFYSRQLIRMCLKWRSWTGTRAIVWGILDGLRNYTGEYGKGRLSAILNKT